jgi:hypothetical protein
MKSGIYKIEIGPFYYFGSSIDLYKRKYAHIGSLKNGVHGNRFMQRAYNKFRDYKFTIVSHVMEKDLFPEEQKLIDLHIKDRNCMNISSVADCPSRCPKLREKLIRRNKSTIWTDEMRKKASLSKKGIKFAPGTFAERSKRYTGTGNPNAKITEHQSCEILSRRNLGETIKSLSDRFGVNRTTITRLCSKHKVFFKPRGWSVAQRESQRLATLRNPQRHKRNNTGTRNGRAKLNEQSVSEIRRMISEGKMLCEIAKIYSVNPETIGAIKSGKNWSKK